MDVELLILVLRDGIKEFWEENESSAIAQSSYFEEIVFMERVFKDNLQEMNSEEISIELSEVQVQVLGTRLQEDIEVGGKNADIEVVKNLVFLKKLFKDAGKFCTEVELEEEVGY